MKKSHAVGIVIILAFVIFGAGAFKNATTPYVSFAEARAASTSVQVKGALDTASIRVDRKSHSVCFNLVEEGGKTLPVVYAKPEPGNFRQATEVVAVGRFTGQSFEADNLLVKCPSKYQGMGDKHPENVDVDGGK